MHYRIITKENWAGVQKMDVFVKNHEKSHFLQTPAWAGVKEAWDWRGILACEGEPVFAHGLFSYVCTPWTGL